MEFKMARLSENIEDQKLAGAGMVSGEAFYELGLMYACGREVEPDLVLAHKWFNIAVVRGHTPAGLKRSELAQEMTREQIALAQKEARAWLTQH
jgi:uncharacterized protein